MTLWRGHGGNREVPPRWILGGAEGNLEEEGGSWGKPGFTRGSEPKASDGHPFTAPRMSPLMMLRPSTMKTTSSGMIETNVPVRTSA
jgi:hypothetical protein